MSRLRLVVVALGTSASLLTMAGCAAVTGDRWTLDEARDLARAAEQIILTHLQEDEIVEATPIDGVLFSCEGHRRYRWVGGQIVKMRTADLAPILDSVARGVSVNGQWSVSRETSDFGSPRLSAVGPSGEYILATGYVNSSGTPKVHVSSVSPCFRLPDDVSPFGTF